GYTNWVPSMWFPWHYETHQKKPMPMEFDRSLPFGMIWRRDWKLTGNYLIRIEATVRALPSAPNGEPKWRQDHKGYALMGICFGGQSLYESWRGGGPRWQKNPEWLDSGCASWMAAWRDDGRFGVYDHATDEPRVARPDSEQRAPTLSSGDRVTIKLAVTGDDLETCNLAARLVTDSKVATVECTEVERKKYTEGYFGLVARGLLDFEVNRVMLKPAANVQIIAPLNELEICYPLGDTLRESKGLWRCRFVAVFRNDGEKAEVRVSDTPNPPGGWSAIPVTGAASIVQNNFRSNTAVIDVTLPANPADKTQYYTVWKDGRDVTADPRVGYVGKKNYVGRLPRLTAPYRLCGLGGHSLFGPAELSNNQWFGENWVHGQPTRDAYRHLEDYNFQILVWEDDVWYLELLLAPPSVDDAYKTIMLTIANPTGRWAMMRHWNTINPGDHDYGIDDAKGPEQFVVRQHGDLGLDPEYVKRNYQIVSHLIRGDEAPSPTANPKNWRRWKMPQGDFSLIILDSRSWRGSQDTRIWDDEGWGHKANVYDRRNPTRTLLGEEQFAWLEKIIRTDSSRMICVSGINALHTVWSGWLKDPETGLRFNQRDRVAADYAGWVKAGADRTLELLGCREGIVTVYGDVHLGCIMQNLEHRVYECCFGAIGRYGGRRVKEGFGPEMTDYDGRPVQIHALYHDKYNSPDLKPRPKHPYNWSFLEMEFDTRGGEPTMGLKLRDLTDPATRESRGGGQVKTRSADTGRSYTCRLPPIRTLPNSDVRFAYYDGRPIRATRSLADGRVPLQGLVGVERESQIVMTACDGRSSEARIITTLSIAD
ncbi:MAG: alkaline phosphatase D family protein, partial [Planctomycetota bacterium]